MEAFAPIDPYEEQDLIVSTFEHADGRRHALVYLADQNFDGLVRQAHIANDPDDVRRAFVESGQLALGPVDAQEVADRLAQGLLIYDVSIHPPCDQDMALARPTGFERGDAIDIRIPIERTEIGSSASRTSA